MVHNAKKDASIRPTERFRRVTRVFHCLPRSLEQPSMLRVHLICLLGDDAKQICIKLLNARNGCQFVVSYLPWSTVWVPISLFPSLHIHNSITYGSKILFPVPPIGRNQFNCIHSVQHHLPKWSHIVRTSTVFASSPNDGYLLHLFNLSWGNLFERWIY